MPATFHGGVFGSSRGGGGGRSGSIGNYQGQFNARTVVMRAFNEDDYIVYDNGTNLELFLATADIPIGSPVPGARNSLWGEFNAQVTGGISRTDLNNALANYALQATVNRELNGKADVSDLDAKANVAALADYLQTTVFDTEKAALQSGINDNRDNIITNDTELDTLETNLQNLTREVENLPDSGSVDVDLGNFAGEFTPTTIVTRAFRASSQILYDNGSTITAWRASAAIPMNSPLPGARGSLWRSIPIEGTGGGISTETLNQRLANYVLGSTYTTDKNRIEGRLTTNETDINSNDQEIDQILRTRSVLPQLRIEPDLFPDDTIPDSLTLFLGTPTVAQRSEIIRLRFILSPHLTSGPGFEVYHEITGVGAIATRLTQGIWEIDFSQAEKDGLASLIPGNARYNHRALLEVSVGDPPNTVVHQLFIPMAFNHPEVAFARSAELSEIESDIDDLEMQVSNIPVSTEVLWATSKVLATSNIAQGVVDTDWVLGDDAPDTVTVDGDVVNIPKGFRGELHVELFDSSDNLVQRRVLDIELGNEDFASPVSPNLRAQIVDDTTDSDFYNFRLNARRTIASLPAGTTCRVYGVTALQNAQVVGITQDQLTEQLIDALVPTSVEVYPKTVKPTKAALLGTLFTLELGKVFPPISTSNRLIVTLQGLPIYNGVLPAFTDDMVISMPIIDSTADNIVTNTTPQLEFYDVNVSFKLNNEPETLASRLLKVAIDRT